MQVDIAFQHNRTSEPHATRHQQTATALGGQRVDSLGKGFGAELHTITDAPAVFHADSIVREHRSLNLGHGERQVLGVDLVRILLLHLLVHVWSLTLSAWTTAISVLGVSHLNHCQCGQHEDSYFLVHVVLVINDLF